MNKTELENKIEALVIDRLEKERLTIDRFALFNICVDISESIESDEYMTIDDRLDQIFESILYDNNYAEHIYILNDDEEYTHYLTAAEIMRTYRDTKATLSK